MVNHLMGVRLLVLTGVAKPLMSLLLLLMMLMHRRLHVVHVQILMVLTGLLIPVAVVVLVDGVVDFLMGQAHVWQRVL